VTQTSTKGRISTQKHTVVLDIVPAHSHKANDMITVLLRVLTDYGLALQDVICIVCDNASANTSMVDKLNAQLAESQSTHRIYISYCVNHSVHRAIVMVTAAAHHVLQPVRRMVFTIHYSGEMCRDLAARVMQADRLCPEYDAEGKPKKSRPLRVICDVPTRWNSLSDMLERLVLLRPEITAMLPSYKTRLPQLTATHWAVIGTMCSAASVSRHCDLLI
jgi:hypothetical protein